jgi:hypothetical protein
MGRPAGSGKSGDMRSEWERLAGKDGWKEYVNNPILKPGKQGEWDHWVIMSMSVVKVGDICHMYYEGGLTSCGDLQIGHASSTDGLHWAKDPANPVLRPGEREQWDDGATWDPFVLYEHGIFKMWYGGERAGHRDFQCGYATSKDGTHFTKKGRISNFPVGDMGDMHVVHDRAAGLYYMFYWDRRFDKAKRLRLARSPNETDFDFDNAAVISIKGEAPGHRYTHVFKDKDTWYMYYGFEGKARMGYATSSDCLDWRAQNTNMMGTEDAEILIMGKNLYFMFYCPEGYQDRAGCDIRLAIFNGDLDDLAAKN